MPNNGSQLRKQYETIVDRLKTMQSKNGPVQRQSKARGRVGKKNNGKAGNSVKWWRIWLNEMGQRVWQVWETRKGKVTNQNTEWNFFYQWTWFGNWVSGLALNHTMKKGKSPCTMKASSIDSKSSLHTIYTVSELWFSIWTLITWSLRIIEVALYA